MPKFLENAHLSLQDLWGNRRITDLHSLRSHCQDSIIFALDIEGSDIMPECGITSVGLALVRDLLGTTRRTNAQADLASMVQEYAIEGHNIMCGKHRRKHGQYERSPFAKLHRVQKGEVDGALNEILESARSTASAPHINLTNFTANLENNDGNRAGSFVMVVWGGQSEFLAIASTIPSAVRNVSHWVNLQDVVASMSATPEQKKPFSLRDTMLSLGFSREHTQKLSRGHSAGMDAVRTIGVLIELCSRAAGDRLSLFRHTMDERSRRKLWESRPKPFENFPFTTKITTAEHLMPPSLRHSQNLLNCICASGSGAAAEPIAVAVCPPRKKKPKRHAWVCFADQGAMDCFVEEWNGKQVDGQVLQVTALPPPE
ncbi:hypothetical protein F4779DRAFT_641085 [Xylariaceae sp. FL0662B]|nr:hypothetical protein F4779DRAFT_641085 [Xylariaceae sp. FL0662B]